MNPTTQRFIPRYRLRTLFVATMLWCLLMGLVPFVTGAAFMALLLLAFCPVGVICVLLWMNPFDSGIRLRFGLRTVFFVTTVLCVLLALASFESGRLFLGLSLLFVGPIGLLYALVVVFSWIFGIPGTRQRSGEQRARFEREAIAISRPPADASIQVD